MPKKEESPKLYLDTCVFVDLLKLERNFASRLGEEKHRNSIKKYPHVLECGKEGSLKLYTSALTLNEFTFTRENKKSTPIYDQEFLNRHDQLFNSGRYLTQIQPHPWVLETARELRWKHHLGLTNLDAIHLASAIDQGCDEFISNDEKSLGKYRHEVESIFGMKITSAENSILIPAEQSRIPLKIEE